MLQRASLFAGTVGVIIRLFLFLHQLHSDTLTDALDAHTGCTVFLLSEGTVVVCEIS